MTVEQLGRTKSIYKPMAFSSGSCLFESAAHAKLYLKFRPTYPTDILDKILPFLCEKISPPFDVAMDIGCGSGQATRYLAPHFREVVGVDVSDGQLQEAQKITKEENIVYRKGSAEEIPAKDNSIDLVTCAHSLHWFNIERFFSECNRVLKPNGCVAAYGGGIPLPCTPNKEIQGLMQEQFNQIFLGLLGPYWDKRTALIRNLYRDVRLPFKDSKRDTSLVRKHIVRVDDMLGFIMSLSSYQAYVRKFPEKADVLSDYRKRFLDILQPLSASTPAEEIEFDFVDNIVILLGRKDENSSETDRINRS